MTRKRILYTQRVEILTDYGERRDAVDQRVPELLLTCGFLPIPVPNHPEIASCLYGKLNADGVFLTGGNSLVKYGGDAPERDVTERCLLDLAIKDNRPVFGICRGLQIIADYYGATLLSCSGHVRTRHEIFGEVVRPQANSYHTLGLREVWPPLVALGQSGDGFIEVLRHERLPIGAVMWHPERESPFLTEDLAMFRDFFTKGQLL